MATPQLLSEELMLGTWFKEYAALGHWFDSAHSKCIHCGTPTIDLYEDGIYGGLRSCKAVLWRDAATGDYYTGESGTTPISRKEGERLSVIKLAEQAMRGAIVGAPADPEAFG